MAVKLIADSGSTKAEWCLLDGKRKKIVYKKGLQPLFFLSSEQIKDVLEKELKTKN